MAPKQKPPDLIRRLFSLSGQGVFQHRRLLRDIALGNIIIHSRIAIDLCIARDKCITIDFCIVIDPRIGIDMGIFIDLRIVIDLRIGIDPAISPFLFSFVELFDGHPDGHARRPF